MAPFDTYSGVKPLTTIGIKATKAEVKNIFDIPFFILKAEQIQDRTSRSYLRFFCI